MMQWTWDLNPIALSIFGLEVRWYGLVYGIGFLGAFLWSTKKYFEPKKKPEASNDKEPKTKKITKQDFENFLFNGFFASILGGRLGYFLFYKISIFWNNPLEIFQIWHGGMSIHGGILGCVGYIFYWTRRHKINFFTIADILVVPLAFVMGFGRLANFVNGELVGRVTDQSWGVVFPHIDLLLRHPSQLYAAIQNFFIFFVLYFLFPKKYKQKGFLSGLFFILYGFFRFLLEFFREPNFLVGPLISMGQWLSLLIVILGIFILFFSFSPNQKKMK